MKSADTTITNKRDSRPRISGQSLPISEADAGLFFRNFGDVAVTVHPFDPFSGMGYPLTLV
jgi:hypothetical protein